jgi:hypothetical protein
VARSCWHRIANLRPGLTATDVAVLEIAVQSPAEFAAAADSGLGHDGVGQFHVEGQILEGRE